MYTDLLQTENERLGTLNLVNLPSFTHSLLDDVAIIIVILQKKKNLNRHINCLFMWESVYSLTNVGQICLLKSLPPPSRSVNGYEGQLFLNDRNLTNPHVLFEDVCSSLHFNHAVDDQFTVGSQEVSSLVQSFNLYCLIVLLPI